MSIISISQTLNQQRTVAGGGADEAARFILNIGTAQDDFCAASSAASGSASGAASGVSSNTFGTEPTRRHRHLSRCSKEINCFNDIEKSFRAAFYNV
jgi:hypothetical protein